MSFRVATMVMMLVRIVATKAQVAHAGQTISRSAFMPWKRRNALGVQPRA